MNIVEKSLLRGQGYSKEQIKELEKGQNNNVDVSTYKDKKNTPFKMATIREGLEKGYPIEKYKNFDNKRLRIIFNGFDDGLSEEKIDLFANEKNDVGFMGFAQEFLSENKEVSFEKSSEIIGAMNSLPNIEKFTIRRLIEIAEGMKSGVDYTLYGKVENTAVFMETARDGLEKKLEGLEKYISLSEKDYPFSNLKTSVDEIDFPDYFSNSKDYYFYTVKSMFEDANEKGVGSEFVDDFLKVSKCNPDQTSFVFSQALNANCKKIEDLDVFFVNQISKNLEYGEHLFSEKYRSEYNGNEERNFFPNMVDPNEVTIENFASHCLLTDTKIDVLNFTNEDTAKTIFQKASQQYMKKENRLFNTDDKLNDFSFLINENNKTKEQNIEKETLIEEEEELTL